MRSPPNLLGPSNKLNVATTLPTKAAHPITVIVEGSCALHQRRQLDRGFAASQNSCWPRRRSPIIVEMVNFHVSPPHGLKVTPQHMDIQAVFNPSPCPSSSNILISPIVLTCPCESQCNHKYCIHESTLL